MTIFTIIAGLAGIISLFLPFIPNLSRWKNYFFYFSFLSIGITIGVIAAMSEKALNSFSGDQLLQLILLVSILSVTSFISFLLIKNGKDLLGYFLLLITLDIFLPQNLEKFKQQKQLIDTQDILFLSKQYQDKGQYQKSGDYLRQYKLIVEETFSKKQLENVQKKINYLDSLQLNNMK